MEKAIRQPLDDVVGPLLLWDFDCRQFQMHAIPALMNTDDLFQVRREDHASLFNHFGLIWMLQDSIKSGADSSAHRARGDPGSEGCWHAERAGATSTSTVMHTELDRALCNTFVVRGLADLPRADPEAALA